MIIEDIVIGMLIGINGLGGTIVVTLEIEEGETTGTETLNPGARTVIVKLHLRLHLLHNMKNQRTMIVKRHLPRLRLLHGTRSQ